MGVLQLNEFLKENVVYHIETQLMKGAHKGKCIQRNAMLYKNRRIIIQTADSDWSINNLLNILETAVQILNIKIRILHRFFPVLKAASLRVTLPHFFPLRYFTYPAQILSMNRIFNNNSNNNKINTNY